MSMTALLAVSVMSGSSGVGKMLLALLACLAAVSYTHLDVYKRQPMGAGRWTASSSAPFTT